MTSPPEPLVQMYNNFRELFLLIPSKNCTNGSALLNKRAPRPPDKKYLSFKISPEPLVQIQNNFTELFLIIPSTKIAQMVPLG